jgi:hypothetical protein
METECTSEMSEVFKHFPWGWRRSVSLKCRRFLNTFPEDWGGVCLWNVGGFEKLSLRMETECVSEMSEIFKHFPWGWKRSVSLKSRRFLNIFPEDGGGVCLWNVGGFETLSLRMETECVSETSEVFKQLTRLSARGESIQVCRREAGRHIR